MVCNVFVFVEKVFTSRILLLADGYRSASKMELKDRYNIQFGLIDLEQASLFIGVTVLLLSRIHQKITLIESTLRPYYHTEKSNDIQRVDQADEDTYNF